MKQECDDDLKFEGESIENYIDIQNESIGNELSYDKNTPRGSYKSTVFRRWAATQIDFLILMGMIFMPSAIAELINDKNGDTLLSILFVAVIVCFISYYVVFEALSGYTIGKFILRIRVIDYEGKAPGFKKGLIRTVLRLLELNPFLSGGIIAGIVALASKYHQRIGDMAAKTQVVKTKELKMLTINKTVKIVIAIYIVITVLFAAFGIFFLSKTIMNVITDQESDNATKVIKSINGDYQLNVSNAWINTIDSAEGDKNIALSIRNIGENIELLEVKYGTLKDIKILGLDNYVSILASYYLESMNGTMVKEVTTRRINGHDAAEFSLSGKVQNDKGIMTITAIKTEETVYTFTGWSSGENLDKELMEIRKVVDTFKQLK